MDGFEDLFSAYWWLLFPLAFFIAAGWSSFMRYKRTQARIDLLKTYAASGREPPAELLADLDRKDMYDEFGMSGMDGDSEGGPGTTAFLFFLFAGLAAVFGYAGYSGLLGDMRNELYLVAMILGVLAVAFLAGGLFGRRR